MHSQNGVNILVRHDELTQQDWEALINCRLEMVRRHLRDMGRIFREIQELQLFDNLPFASFSIIKNCRPNVVVEEDENLSLQTKVFVPSRDYAEVKIRKIIHHRPPGSEIGRVASIYRFWALTRDGDWITVEAVTKISQERRPGKERTDEKEEVTQVTLRKALLPEMCTFSKYSMLEVWKALGEMIRSWANDRRRLLEEAELAASTSLIEEEVYETLVKKLHAAK